jgi:lysophospholipase L1-like esterase
MRAAAGYGEPVKKSARTGSSAGAAALAVALVLSLAGCSGSSGDSGPPKNPTRSATPKATPTPLGLYVALGDSYTSGPGIPDQVGKPAGCDRSSRNYPALIAQKLKLAATAVRDLSCSGATIADLAAPQVTTDGTNPAQLSALAPGTALVTLGIGGNDVDFAGVLSRCVELDVIPAMFGSKLMPDLTPCRAYYTSGGVDQLQQKIQAAAGPLATALAQIKQRAPHARVYVVGYPALLPATGTTCADTLGVTSGDVAYLSAEELRLNSMLRQAAQAAEATYVDTYTPSVGHDACSAAASRWIEPLLVGSSGVPLHPNALGEQGMADAVERAISTAG